MATNGDDVQNGPFLETRWSLIGRIVGAEGVHRNPAIDELLTLYLPVLIEHVTRRFRFDQNRAEDLVQDFVLKRILEQDLIGKADRSRGRFRSLLMSSLDRFVIDSIRRDNATKRMPDHAGRLDSVGDLQAHNTSSNADVFDSLWAKTVLQDALCHMKAQFEPDDPAWTVFVYRVLLPVFNTSEPVDYATLAIVCGLESERQAANYLVTAKRSFGRCLRTVVGMYIADEKEIEGEIDELRRVFSADPPPVDEILPVNLFPDVRRSLTEVGYSSVAAGGLCQLFAHDPDDPAHATLERLMQTPLRQLLSAEVVLPGFSGWDSRNLHDLLTAENPPVEILKATKQLGQTWTRDGRSESCAQVGATIYFLSIAAAHLHNGELITSLTRQKLDFGIRQIMNTTQLVHPYVGILEECLKKLWDKS